MRSLCIGVGVAVVASGVAAVGGCRFVRTSPSGAAVARTLTPKEMSAGQAYTPLMTQDEMAETNIGCLSCHGDASDSLHTQSMHPAELPVFVACVDCHGGDPGVRWDRPAIAAGDPRARSSEYLARKRAAHVARPRFPAAWSDPQTGEISSANPVRSYTLLNFEDPAYVRFVNPGDLRVAHFTCGRCHMGIVQRVRNSMMTHGAQLWQAALYNNGSYPEKTARFGESYAVNGLPQRLYSLRQPTEEESRSDYANFYRRYTPTAAERARGVLDFLDPLPRWEITQMGNILRAFERGGKVQRLGLELGLPSIFEEPGKPDMKLSDRGLGTQLATDPVFLSLQKTRLLDPILSFLGTNDYPGEFRSSGCSACHVVYANDREPVHSGPYARFGNRGLARTTDPTIPADEPGHPIRHEMTTAIPSSQCVVCHVHPGTSFANSYLGYTWWDNETHGELMYPKSQRYPTAEQYFQALLQNPEGASVRGLWSNLWTGEPDHQGDPAPPRFLQSLWTKVNPKMDKTQFADFHGHGWVFRAVFKQDRKGRMLDRDGNVVHSVTPEKLRAATAFTAKQRGEAPPPDTPVHLKDIHLERGMHCVDCHFEQDVHGDGKLYGEVRNAIEIDCIDCHGTVNDVAKLVTSGPAGGNDLRDARYHTAFGERFWWAGKDLWQQSAVERDTKWKVPQIRYAVDQKDPEHYNPKAARAKLMQRDGKTWDDPACPQSQLAHANDNMTCYACHTSWMTSCFGCHLPMRANMRMPMLHNEGLLLRNFTQYNFQVVRDDVFMLGRDSTVKGGRIAPVRSSSAVIVGSANANREWIYSQQQTVSAEGYSGHAFNPHFPHAVRKTETKRCTDCHISEANDNNAWLAQVLLQGTNFVNFLGRYVWVARGDHGLEAVVVTEREEPQAVIGSYLHEVAYPDNFAEHVKRGLILNEAHEHGLNDALVPRFGMEILDVQVRGEYLYTARGKGGFYAYDIANIDNKGFSERIITAPVSPLGQSLHVKTAFATAVASPTTLAVDPTRRRLSSDPTKPPATIVDPPAAQHVNQEQAVHPLYAFLYVTDLYEGLVVIGDPKQGVATLLDGDPTNNFLRRATTFNPEGALDGAVNLVSAGHYAYICCQRGLVVVDLSNPLAPSIVAEVGAPYVNKPTAVAIQFRYAFVCDLDGLKVLDVTQLAHPEPVENAVVPIADARRLYVARTYAYVAAGKQGLVIVDVQRPESPRIDRIFNANGSINDACDVKVGMTNASAFAYVADGRNGLRVIQLTSPRDTPGYAGFGPRPTPRLIATYPIKRGRALAISKGLDRDRAVDESGHQIAVFGRLGARPLNYREQRRLYVRDGALYSVSDEVPKNRAAGE